MNRTTARTQRPQPRSTMKAMIRSYKPSDQEATLVLSLRAWKPVFNAIEKLIGSELLLLLRGDWRADQANQVRDVLTDVAAEPRHQGGGIGTALTETARNWFQASGMRVAMIETGGGPGHTPRSPHLGEGRLSALPVVRFFKALLD